MGAGFHTFSLILILVSFVILLLATISAPIVPVIRLGLTSSYSYGVFGDCRLARDSCTKVGYPYTLGDVEPRGDWLLAQDTRSSLAKALILVPIACGINLLTFLLILFSHFFSSGVLILSMVFNIVSFLLTAVVCVLVCIMFAPNIAWCGWLLVVAGAFNLIAIIGLILALRVSGNKYDEDDQSVNELNTFDDKFGGTNNNFNRGFGDNYAGNVGAGGYGAGNGFVAPGNKFNDNSSSISRDYDFKATPHQPPQKLNTMTNSSIYNSNPQLAKDFTQQDYQQNDNSVGSRTIGSSHFEDAQVSIVNGPNTPISSKQQMAPTFVPNVATPTMNDMPKSNLPNLPYPADGPLNKPPYNGADMSVFEHHPEVEGHRPFTELDDDLAAHPGVAGQYHRGSQTSDEIVSDASSDFTSVSQRAINPRYNPQDAWSQNQQPPPPPPHQQPYHSAYPNQQPFQPRFQQPQPSMQQSQMNMGQQMHQPQMNMGPQMHQPQMMQGPPMQQMSSMPSQHRFVVPRNAPPTASDNALANNPDFALGPAARRKPGMNKPNMAPSRMGIPGLGTPRPGHGGAPASGPYAPI